MLDEYIGVNTATAHPHVDTDGTVYNMASSFAGKEGSRYSIVKFPPPAVVDGVLSCFYISLPTVIPTK